MAVVAHNQRLLELVDEDVQVEQIGTGYQFTEGPVWNSRAQSLVFSCIYSDTMYRWVEGSPPVAFRQPSHQANGNTYDGDGRLVTCEHESRQITVASGGEAPSTLVSHYLGRRFNSPNDVVGAANGDLFFTDPNYGLRQPDGSFLPGELDFNGIYRLARDGTVTLVSKDLAAPNGLVITDDQKTLLVDDTVNATVRGFAIRDDGSIGNAFQFCDVQHDQTVGRPDGMKLDSLGNLYVAANTSEGIWVFDREGELLGFIGLPETPANCAWGGPDWQTLFVTAKTSVYRLQMKVPGQKVIGQ